MGCRRMSLGRRPQPCRIDVVADALPSIALARRRQKGEGGEWSGGSGEAEEEEKGEGP